MVPALDHVKKRYNESEKQSRWSHAAVNCNLCIFCGDEINAADHSFQKVTLTEQILDIIHITNIFTRYHHGV